MTASPIYVCTECGVEDDDEIVVAEHMKQEHGIIPASNSDG